MTAQSDPSTTEPLARLHATVHGHVQGVGFRYFVRDQAQRLALRGWVRNCDNGDVELEAEGPRPQLERLLRAVQRGRIAEPARQRVGVGIDGGRDRRIGGAHEGGIGQRAGMRGKKAGARLDRRVVVMHGGARSTSRRS